MNSLKNKAYAMARKIVAKKCIEQFGVEKAGVILENKKDLILELANKILPKLQEESIRNINEKFEDLAEKIAPENKKEEKEAKKRCKHIEIKGEFDESAEGIALAKKSNKSGISIDILSEVYNRGLDSWNESKGVTQVQYAFARVNSFINGGKAIILDKDLIEGYEEDQKEFDKNIDGINKEHNRKSDYHYNKAKEYSNAATLNGTFKDLNNLNKARAHDKASKAHADAAGACVMRHHSAFYKSREANKLSDALKEETVIDEAAEYGKEYPHSHVMQRINNGDWEAHGDVNPGKTLEITDRTKNKNERTTIRVGHEGVNRRGIHEETGTRPFHYGVVLEKGNWGSQKYKHVRFTQHLPNDRNHAQPDGDGHHGISPAFIHRTIHSHPQIKKHLGDGWTITHNIASLDKTKVDKEFEDHRKNKTQYNKKYDLEEAKAKSYVKKYHNDKGEHIGYVSSDGYHKKYWQNSEGGLAKAKSHAKVDSISEDVKAGDKQPVVVPAHYDQYNNAIPAKTVLKRVGRKIIDSGNVHDGKGQS